MASAKTIEHRKAVLRAKGVPERFIEPLATRKSNGLAELLSFLIVVGLILGWASIQVAVMAPAGEMLADWLYAGVQKASFFSPTILFDYFCIIASLLPTMLVLFGGLAVWSLLFPERVRPWPAYSATATALRMLGRNNSLKSTKPLPQYQQLGHLTSEVAFLEALIWRSPTQLVTVALQSGVVILCLSAGLGFVAANDYIRIVGTRVEVHHAWSTGVFQLSEVTRAESRCQNMGKDAGYHYALRLPGTRLELFPAPSVMAGRRRGILQSLARLDQALWTMKKQDVVVGPPGETADPYNGCIVAWRKKAGVADLPFPGLAHSP
jgi:hypothetical protein